jgi:tetratricopeptide (TPR) repeat protein
MEVLLYLAEHAEQVVSRRQILDAVWRQEFVSDATLSGTIAKLRRALADDARRPCYIETLSKRGYRLLVRPAEDLEQSHSSGSAVRNRGSGDATPAGGAGPAAAVAVTQPSASVTSFPELRAGTERPVFVKREAELTRLDRLLEKALAGEGRIAFVTGEAGTGKTALIQEFVRRAGDADDDLVVAAGISSAQTGTGDAYAPWRQLLALLTGDVESGLASGTMLAGLGRRVWRTAPITAEAVTVFGRDLVGTLIPGAAMLTRVQAAAPVGVNWLPQLRELVQLKASLPPDAALQQGAVFMQVARVLAAVARRRPLLLVLEDLHWADAGSIAMLFHLSREITSHRILALGSYRTTDVALGRGGERHPLEPMVAELRGRQSQLMIELGEVGDRAFVDALVDCEPNRLGEEFRRRLFQQTAGHALFTVETLRSLQERDMIARDPEGRWVESEYLDWTALPERVEGVIGARIERLSEPLRELLAVAGVEGETFTAEVVALVRNESTRATIRRLSRELETRHRLVRARGVRARNDDRLSMFGFSHVLYQRYLYAGLNEVERAQLHMDVGSALEELWGDDTEEVAPQLARHFEVARDINRAVHYLHQAGVRANNMTAHGEAIGHLKRALGLLSELTASPQRDARELELRLALQIPLVALSGWAHDRSGQEAIKSRQLAERIGDPGQLARVLLQVGAYEGSTIDLSRAIATGERILELAEAQDDDAARVLANLLLGWVTSMSGNLERGRGHLEEIQKRYDPVRHHALALHGGIDPGVGGLSHPMWVLSIMGHLDEAVRCKDDALELARRLGHPHSLAFARSMTAYPHLGRREFDQAREEVEAFGVIIEDHGFEHYRPTFQYLSGILHLGAGQQKEAVELITGAVEGHERMGVKTAMAAWLGSLARVHYAAGEHRQALEALDRADQLVTSFGEEFARPEILQNRAEIAIAMGDGAAAEGCYTEAIETARSQRAKLHELNSAVGLARLWRERGRCRQAHDLLAPIFGWFTEGLDTGPLVEARTLLGELAQNE